MNVFVTLTDRSDRIGISVNVSAIRFLKVAADGKGTYIDLCGAELYVVESPSVIVRAIDEQETEFNTPDCNWERLHDARTRELRTLDATVKQLREDAKRGLLAARTVFQSQMGSAAPCDWSYWEQEMGRFISKLKGGGT